MDSLRQSTVIREIEPATEIDFPSPSSVPVHSTESEPRELVAIFQLLWDRRQLLWRVARWALALSIIIAFLIPSQYQSSVRIMPPDSMGNASGILAALAGKGNPELMAMAGSLLGLKGSGALFVDLFHSRSVQDRVVERLNLQKVYRARYKQDARKRLDSCTDVSEDRKSGVIRLVVTDHSPGRARDIAQAYVEELNTVVAQVSTSSARRERIFIEQRLVSVKSDLENAEKAFSVFASSNMTLDIKEQTRAMVESAAMLQGQMIAAQSELQGLEQIYNSDNVRIRALRAKVGELQRQLENMRGTDSSLAPDADEPNQMYPSIRKLPLLGVEWTDLYRRMKIQETVYELLNQQYELARIQEAKEIPTVNVVDPADVPERKSGPSRALIILVVTMVAVAGAAVWVLFLDRWELVPAADSRKVLLLQIRESIIRPIKRLSASRFMKRSRLSNEGEGITQDETGNDDGRDRRR